jgi:hypothetical protein
MRTRSWVLRCGAWSIVWLVAGCDMSSAQSIHGTIVATVSRDSPPLPAAGARVTLISTLKGSITNISGTAVLSNVAPGTYQVRAAFIGFCTSTVTATVTAGNTTNVTLHLGSAPCAGAGKGELGGGAVGGVDAGGGGGNDKIVTTGSDPTVVLVDIRTGNVGDPSPCENDRLVEGTGGISDIGTNALTLTDPSVTCHGAAWIFTSEHAPWFENKVASFPWTNSGGDVVNATLPANRLRVPLTIWIADPAVAANYTTLMMTDLPKANGFLREQRTGLILTNSETADNLPDIIDVRGQSGVIGNGCHRLSSIMASPAVYRPAHLNVYVVKSISPSSAGWTCADYAVPNVIFLADGEDFVTLVHEVGHALSLTRPYWGHTQNIAGMYPGNVMEWGASGAGHLSLGQITRMHADAQSWLNQVTGIGTVRSRQSVMAPFVTACSCPGANATEDCPAITRDLPRSGSAWMGNAKPAACHVRADVSCVSLTPNSPTAITATSWTDGTALTKGFGEQLVRSANPAVADVVAVTTTDNVVLADIRAGSSTGATRVFLSVGGSLATVTVKVSQPCP